MVEGLGQRVAHRHLPRRLVGARRLDGRDGLVREDLEGLHVLEARARARSDGSVDLEDADELVAGRERDEEQVVRVPRARRRAAPAAVDPAGRSLGGLLRSRWLTKYDFEIR